MNDNSRLFDDWAASFDADVAASDGSFPFAGYRAVLRRMTELVVARNPRSVLDLGCGTGVLLGLIAAAAPAVRLVGVDFSSEMLKRARSAVPTARFLDADIAGDLVPFGLPKFDAIVSSYVVHEFSDDRKVDLLATARRDLLTRHGIVVVGDIGFASVAARDATRQSEPFWDDTEHYMAADELLPMLASRDIRATWEQVSFCAGVLLIDG